jgi:hypothetical protein
MRSPRYSPRQLVAAKCVVVAVFSVAGAIAIADDRGDLPAYTFVMLGLLALGFAGYELLPACSPRDWDACALRRRPWSPTSQRPSRARLRQLGPSAVAFATRNGAFTPLGDRFERIHCHPERSERGMP